MATKTDMKVANLASLPLFKWSSDKEDCTGNIAFKFMYLKVIEYKL